jgi:hypothetical protein
LPDDAEIGATHDVFENFNGCLQYTSRRTLRYAGAGRWEIAPGTHALWHELGGSICHWSANTEAQIAQLRADLATVTAERENAQSAFVQELGITNNLSEKLSETKAALESSRAKCDLYKQIARALLARREKA